MCALILDRKYLHAAMWCGAAAVLSIFGLMHSEDAGPPGVVTPHGEQRALSPPRLAVVTT